MPTHSVAEAFDAVWTGACEVHDGAHPVVCGAKADLYVYEKESEALESWYLK